LPGPKFRIGRIKGGKVLLKRRTSVVLTGEPESREAYRIPVTLPNLADHVKRGRIILLDDGAIQLRVTAVENGEVTSKVIVGGTLTDGRGLVVPGMRNSGPFVTDTLREHISFAIRQQPDYIALSFVSSADDIEAVREILGSQKSDIPIIAKIERGEAVKRFDRILKASDGIMVARGDLGVDIPLEMVPLVQKEIIRKCNRAGKPVITATQMLESMIAETSDVANAILDGTDATMLSGETSVGKYPVQCVTMMAKIALQAEKTLPYDQMLQQRSKWLEHATDEMISYNACHTAYQLGAEAIVAFTESGSTARRVSRYRPQTPVVAITPYGAILGRLNLYWGVVPMQTEVVSSIDEVFQRASGICKEAKLAKSGDRIVITAGVPIGETGTTNLLKVQRIE